MSEKNLAYYSQKNIIETFLNGFFDDNDWVTVKVWELRERLNDVGRKLKYHYKDLYQIKNKVKK